MYAIWSCHVPTELETIHYIAFQLLSTTVYTLRPDYENEHVFAFALMISVCVSSSACFLFPIIHPPISIYTSPWVEVYYSLHYSCLYAVAGTHLIP